jgi:hypothetical protein
MTAGSWLATNWFTAVQTLGIISSILFTAHQLRRSHKLTQLSHMLEITKAHREIWGKMLDKPELARILDPKANLTEPINPQERKLVTFVILHLQCAFELSKHNEIVPIEGLKQDVSEFFSLPIPQKVWNELSRLQNSALMDFVERQIGATSQCGHPQDTTTPGSPG